MALEEVDQPDKIEQGAGDPVELVDEDDVDEPSLDVAQQSLKLGALKGRTRAARIVVVFFDLTQPLCDWLVI